MSSRMRAEAIEAVALRSAHDAIDACRAVRVRVRVGLGLGLG